MYCPQSSKSFPAVLSQIEKRQLVIQRTQYAMPSLEALRPSVSGRSLELHENRSIRFRTSKE
jgi:hypothetical protein